MISKEKIKFLRSLQRKKNRDVNQLFIIEGPKMIEEALTSIPDAVQSIYSVKEFTNLPKGIDFFQIDSLTLSQISSFKNPQECIGVCTYLPVKKQDSDFYLALDTIQDPGNFGTILRLAAWFGVENILVSHHNVDLYNPKVVQASMGAIFNTNVLYTDLEKEFSQTKLPIYGAVMNGRNIYEEKIKRQGILLMGNEGKGISEELLPYLTYPITIPRLGKGESLNVAMATAILLSEFYRG